MKKSRGMLPWLYSLPSLLLIGLENYRRALFKLDSGFLDALGTTLLWTAVNMVLQATAAYFIALDLNVEGLKARRIYKTLLMFPWAMPAYVSILVWRVGMYNTEFGLLNKLLVALGGTKVDFLSKNMPAFLACLVLNLWMALPFMIVMMDGALQSIDRSLYESSLLDGAGFIARNIYITVVK